jgi:broad specificity phosphatase PhoE
MNRGHRRAGPRYGSLSGGRYPPPPSGRSRVARPELWLARHGETEWSRDGRHTSHTDLPLTPAGVEETRLLARSLAGVRFDLVITSPLRRAADTAALLGFPDARRDPAVAEWDYGDYEGLTTATIREKDADWHIWNHHTPGGETAEQVAARADRVIERALTDVSERALIVSHGHFLRVLAARWVGQPAAFGMALLLGTAALSVLGWEREARGIRHWNLPPGTRLDTAPQPETGADPAVPPP